MNPLGGSAWEDDIPLIGVVWSLKYQYLDIWTLIWEVITGLIFKVSGSIEGEACFGKIDQENGEGPNDVLHDTAR